MPISDLQYEKIKEYVTERLSSEEYIFYRVSVFCENFHLEKPFFRELYDRVEKDQLPWRPHIRGEYKDEYGDPLDRIYFERT